MGRNPKSRFRAGFTLIELSVVMGIIVLLLGVVFYNFRTSAKTKSARHQIALELLSNIRRAQSMALAGSSYNDQIVCGFGVYFTNTTNYLIYAQKPVSGTCVNVNYAYSIAGNSSWVIDRVIVKNSNFNTKIIYS